MFNDVYCSILFIIISINWKQPEHPLVELWFNKSWCIYMLEYYAAINKNKADIYKLMWDNTQEMLLNEKGYMIVSKVSQKNICFSLG